MVEIRGDGAGRSIRLCVGGVDAYRPRRKRRGADARAWCVAGPCEHARRCKSKSKIEAMPLHVCFSFMADRRSLLYVLALTRPYFMCCSNNPALQLRNYASLSPAHIAPASTMYTTHSTLKQSIQAFIPTHPSNQSINPAIKSNDHSTSPDAPIPRAVGSGHGPPQRREPRLALLRPRRPAGLEQGDGDARQHHAGHGPDREEAQCLADPDVARLLFALLGCVWGVVG